MEYPLLPVRVLHADPALGKVRAVALDGEHLWAAADSGAVLEVALPEGRLLRRFHGHKGGVVSLCVRADRITTEGRDGHVKTWDVAGLALVSDAPSDSKQAPVLLPSIQGADITAIHAVVALRELDVIVGPGIHREVLLELYGPAQGQIRGFRLPYGVACLVGSPDGRVLYAGGNGRVFAIDLPAV